MGSFCRLCKLCAAFLAALVTAQAHAGGFSNSDFGIRRMGMFAVVANPDDPTAVFHNPAGMVLLEGTQIYHAQSWFMAHTGIRYYDQQGNLHPDHEITPDWNVAVIPFLGVVTDVGQEKLRLGFAAYIPNAYGAAMPEDEPSRYHGTEAVFVAGRLTMSLAYLLDEQLSVAASANMIFAYLTTQQYMNPLVFADPDVRFDPARQQALEDSDWTIDIEGTDLAFSMDFGILFRPHDRLRIGAVLATGALVEPEGEFIVTAPSEVLEGRQVTGIPIPLELRFGVSWDLTDTFEVACDLRWWHYQVFQEQRSTISFSGASADSPTLALLGQVLTNDQLVMPKSYDNSWNWNVGMKYRLLPELELMVGYQQDYTPIPETTVGLDNPTRDLRGIAVGARWRIDDQWRVGVGYIRNWFDLLDVQTNVNTPPFNVKGHGSNDAWGLDVMWTVD